MKKSISILLCIAMILSSFSFAAAVDWSTTDSSNLASIKNAVNSGGVLYALVSTISSRLQFNNVSLGQMVQNIYNALYSNSGGASRSVGWWLNTMNDNLVTIAGFLDPANSQSMAGILNNILNMISYSDATQGLKSWLSDIWQVNSLFLPQLDNLQYLSIALTNKYRGQRSGWTAQMLQENLHRQMYGLNSETSQYSFSYVGTNGSLSTGTAYWSEGSPIGNLAFLLQYVLYNQTREYQNRWNADLTNYNQQQSAVNWTTLGTNNFTPTSSTNGLYTWLKLIQEPVARLSYVLASDERIEAQELAAANEQAVVDEFIDSTGNGSVPTSSFSDVSGLSSGVTSNLSTDASPAQIWDIFNSDHGSWFSQETANQLDTTTRIRGSEFETPLLDQQMEEIYKSLGGGK